MLLQGGQNGLLFMMDHGEGSVLISSTGNIQFWRRSWSILSSLANDHRMLLFRLCRLLMDRVDDVDWLISTVHWWSGWDAILGDVSVESGEFSS